MRDCHASREMVLTENGFAVVSALGNREARHALAGEAPFDAFLVSWSTTYEERKAIVIWLKQHWPAIPVVAIHDSFQRPIPGADVTATHDTPEEWLAAVEAAARNLAALRLRRKLLTTPRVYRRGPRAMRRFRRGISLKSVAALASVVSHTPCLLVSKRS
jgi:hypothetical protein